jgi:hypothetical protein
MTGGLSLGRRLIVLSEGALPEGRLSGAATGESFAVIDPVDDPLKAEPTDLTRSDVREVIAAQAVHNVREGSRYGIEGARELKYICLAGM